MGQVESLSELSLKQISTTFLKLSQQYCPHSEAIPTKLLAEFFQQEHKESTPIHDHHFLTSTSIQNINSKLSLGPYFISFDFSLFIQIAQFLPFFDIFQTFSHVSKKFFLLSHDNSLWFMIFSHTFYTQNILPSPILLSPMILPSSSDSDLPPSSPKFKTSHSVAVSVTSTPTSNHHSNNSSPSSSPSSSSSSSSTSSDVVLDNMITSFSTTPTKSNNNNIEFVTYPLTKCCWRYEFFSHVVDSTSENILIKIIQTLIVKKTNMLLVLQEDLDKLRNKIQKEKEEFEIEYHKAIELRRQRYYHCLHGIFLALFLFCYWLGIFEIFLLPSYYINNLCLYLHLYPSPFEGFNHTSFLLYGLSFLFNNIFFIINYLWYVIILCYIILGCYRHGGIQPTDLCNQPEIDRIFSCLLGLRSEEQTWARYNGRLQLIDTCYEEELLNLQKQQAIYEVRLRGLQERLTQSSTEDCILM